MTQEPSIGRPLTRRTSKWAKGINQEVCYWSQILCLFSVFTYSSLFFVLQLH